MQLEIDVEAPWPDGAWEALVARVAGAAASVAPELGHSRLSASVLFTSDAEIRQLNHDWRGRDKPTNVLSFPMLHREELLRIDRSGPPEMIGDIAVAYETCAREAAEKGIPLDHHVAHLVLHGFLHLAGHDHEISHNDAEVMEALETKALALLGIADPYGGRVAP